MTHWQPAEVVERLRTYAVTRGVEVSPRRVVVRGGDRTYTITPAGVTESLDGTHAKLRTRAATDPADQAWLVASWSGRREFLGVGDAITEDHPRRCQACRRPVGWRHLDRCPACDAPMRSHRYGLGSVV